MRAESRGSVEPLAEAVLSPYKTEVWPTLTPRERLRAAWKLRKRLKNPRAVHDARLFPKP